MIQIQIAQLVDNQALLLNRYKRGSETAMSLLTGQQLLDIAS